MAKHTLSTLWAKHLDPSLSKYICCSCFAWCNSSNDKIILDEATSSCTQCHSANGEKAESDIWSPHGESVNQTHYLSEFA